MTFDAENRLTAVAGGSTSASFIYDADGSRTVGTVDGVTTVFIGGVYEWVEGASACRYAARGHAGSKNVWISSKYPLGSRTKQRTQGDKKPRDVNGRGQATAHHKSEAAPAPAGSITGRLVA